MPEVPHTLDSLRIDREPSRGPAGRGLLWVLAIVIVVSLISGGFWTLRQNAGPQVRTHVVLASAVSEGGQVALNGSGYVVARRSATVSSKVTGKVAEVLLEEGMRVQEDQILARLDDTNARAALRLAEAQRDAARATLAETRASLERAERELRRIESLSQDQVASESDLDGARAELRTLQARLERQQAEIVVAERMVAVQQQGLEDTIIRAPFSGMTTAKNAQPGEMISPMSAGGGFTRTGIGTIVDMRSLEIEVEVNESFLQRVQSGQRVQSTLDAYPDWQIPGRVIAIIPTADRQKATVKVRVGFDELDPRILPEMGVRVNFLADPGSAPDLQAVVVPRPALHKFEGQDIVWVLQDGRVERRSVKLGELRTDEASVTQGLKPGDRVVVESSADLRPNMRVREKAS